MEQRRPDADDYEADEKCAPLRAVGLIGTARVASMGSWLASDTSQFATAQNFIVDASPSGWNRNPLAPHRTRGQVSRRCAEFAVTSDVRNTQWLSGCVVESTRSSFFLGKPVGSLIEQQAMAALFGRTLVRTVNVFRGILSIYGRTPQNAPRE